MISHLKTSKLNYSEQKKTRSALTKVGFVWLVFFCIFPLTFGHYLTNVVTISSSERNKLFLLSFAHQGIEHLRPALWFPTKLQKTVSHFQMGSLSKSVWCTLPICPEKKEAFRFPQGLQSFRIEDLAGNLKLQLKKKADSSDYFVLAL